MIFIEHTWKFLAQLAHKRQSLTAKKVQIPHVLATSDMIVADDATLLNTASMKHV